jgi:hypothetical protein
LEGIDLANRFRLALRPVSGRLPALALFEKESQCQHRVLRLYSSHRSGAVGYTLQPLAQIQLQYSINSISLYYERRKKAISLSL